jgi:hypothetical protein
MMLHYSLALIAMVLAATLANANDLKDLYELALRRDASLQAAGFQRDAAIEVSFSWPLFQGGAVASSMPTLPRVIC